MDKTQHEYLAGKLKLQNSEKDQAKERKSNIPEAPVGQVPTFNPPSPYRHGALSFLLFSRNTFGILWDANPLHQETSDEPKQR